MPNAHMLPVKNLVKKQFSAAGLGDAFLNGSQSCPNPSGRLWPAEMEKGGRKGRPQTILRWLTLLNCFSEP